MDAVTIATAPTHAGILGLDHVRLTVDDLDLAVRFYRDVLGAELVERHAGPPPRGLLARRTPGDGRPARALFRLGRGPSLQLVLSTRRPPRGDDQPLWAFAIAPSDVAGFRHRLTAAGVPHVGPAATGPLGQASIYLHDPAGNLLELTTTAYTGAVTV
jgi:catechol 2,3-dioxygenase-like lactoylglutathione lyase family enzyme